MRVVDVDIKRKRIGLTMRKQEGGAGKPEQRAGDGTPRRKPAGAPPERSRPTGQGREPPQGAFGAALAEALKRR